MANALQLSGTGGISCGRVAAVDNMLAATHVVLYRGALPPDATFARKGSGGTVGWYAGVNPGPNRLTYMQIHATTAHSYQGTFESLPNATNVWNWGVLVRDPAAAAGSRSRFYGAQYGNALVDDGVNPASNDSVGDLVNDSSAGIDLGLGLSGESYNMTMAFWGVIGSALTLAQSQAVVDSMATASWLAAIRLGWNGVTTAPDFTGALSPTVNGTQTLVTTAPEYWTGSASPTIRRLGFVRPARRG